MARIFPSLFSFRDYHLSRSSFSLSNYSETGECQTIQNLWNKVSNSLLERIFCESGGRFHSNPSIFYQHTYSAYRKSFHKCELNYLFGQNYFWNIYFKDIASFCTYFSEICIEISGFETSKKSPKKSCKNHSYLRWSKQKFSLSEKVSNRFMTTKTDF